MEGAYLVAFMLNFIRTFKEETYNLTDHLTRNLKANQNWLEEKQGDSIAKYKFIFVLF